MLFTCVISIISTYALNKLAAQLAIHCQTCCPPLAVAAVVGFFFNSYFFALVFTVLQKNRSLHLTRKCSNFLFQLFAPNCQTQLQLERRLHPFKRHVSQPQTE